MLLLQEGAGISALTVEAVDEHGEVTTLWNLAKPPNQDLWTRGQVHIKNAGDKQYMVGT